MPVVLPQATATVDDTGHARIVLDNLDHQDKIDCPDGLIGRDELGAALASIAEQIGGPVRVEIREPDGSRYADILQPRTPEPNAGQEPADDEPPETALVRGEGFLPDETVLVAVVAATVQAQPDGSASLTTLPAPPRSGGEVILFGGASGRVVPRQFPTAPVARKRRWWRR